jgi:aldose 1-epimerase
MQITKKIWGNIDNSDIILFKFSGSSGQYIEITNFGGIVHSWFCLDKNGKLEDILLGCKDLEGYQNRHPYFGAIIGRCANRIAHGKFSLDGQDYTLQCNLPPHHLHGGNVGFDKKIWDYEIINDAHQATLILKTVSQDGEEGYPGNLDLCVQYTYTDENQLIIKYEASTDKATPINLTNHGYFNLSGNTEKNILDHEMFIQSNHITESDSFLIPTGNFLDITDTVLDFSTSTKIGQRMDIGHELLKHQKGYDHNFLLDNGNKNEPVAIVKESISGRILKVYTDRPAIQLYTGNWLYGVDGKNGTYQDYAGFCLETQSYPDAPNHSNFPDSILRPGDTFNSETSYQVIT